MSHAANPLALHIDGDVYRVFYSGRDVSNRSSVGAVEIDIVRQKLIREYRDPFFECGPGGSFYADGVSIGNSYEVDGARYMLFMGWENPKGGHWRGDVGQLVVRGDLTLGADGDGAFLEVDATDPISLSYPWVMKRAAGGSDIWYGSTLAWDAGNGEMLHVINHASSLDGHQWRRNGLAVPYEIGVAQAFSRPTVVYNEADGYRMWYSYRGALAPSIASAVRRARMGVSGICAPTTRESTYRNRDGIPR